MNVLNLEQVSHAYGETPAIRDVDLTVGEGELVCLLGPSGCGKTTVLRVAAGLETLQAGRVSIGGEEVARPGVSRPPEDRGVGLVFQDYALFPHLTVAENVGFGVGCTPAAAREMLERVDMAGHAERYPHALSGGEQQRVALARALAPKPRLLLLDEPFSGLDIRLRDKVRDVTLRVLQEAGIATLIVTHDPEEAMYMADRIALMREGRIVQSGAPAEVYRAPASTFAATFLSDVNWMHGTVADGAVASVFGRLDAGGMADGMRVDVLIRPEAISVADGASSVLADVVAVHPLGHSSIVALRLAESGAELRARLPGSRVPKVGARISVALDRDQTFVFPCAPPNGAN